MYRRISLIAFLLVSGALSAEDSTAFLKRVREQAEPVRSQLLSIRGLLGLTEKSDFKAFNLTVDPQGDRHLRFHHFYNGVRVFGSETIVPTDAQGNRKGQPIHRLYRGLDLDVNPRLAEAEVLGLVQERLATPGTHRNEPTPELVIYPVKRQARVSGAEGKADQELNALDVTEVVDRYALAYYVQTRMERPDGRPEFTDSIVDAQTGETLAQWDALQTSSAQGTGNTLYSGTVTINTNSTGSTYELRDISRATSPYFNVTPNGSSTVYTSTSNVFGNGTTSSTQSAAADAMWGMQATYDAMLNCYSWRGVDNGNTGLNAKVHLNDDNAYFDGGNTLTFGDGISMFKPLVEVDVVAHEYGHAICQATSNLTYSGESGGLNEANSDMTGTLVEFYANGGKTGNVIPSSGGDWVLGAKISKNGSPLRYMYKPSKDGSSPDAWYSGMGNLDVHYSSGPANRMFYFLSQGSTASGDTSSSYLQYGPIQGIGIHKAGAIWLRAQTTKFTSGTSYSYAASYCRQAAEELYGAGSLEAKTVQRAFAAINVGTDIQIGTTGLAIATQPANATVQAGGTATFTVAATGGTTPYAYQWYRNGAAISGGTSASYTFTAQSADSGAKFKAVVTDDSGASVTSSEATLTVSTTPPQGGEKLVNGGFEQGTASWAGNTGVIGNWSSYNEPAYEGTKAAYLGGNGRRATEKLYQAVTIPSTATSATLRFQLHIDTAETGNTVYDRLAVQILSNTGSLRSTLATYSNVNKAAGYQLRSFDLSAFKGKTIRVNFNMTEDASLQTSFLVDQVSLIVQ